MVDQASAVSASERPAELGVTMHEQMLRIRLAEEAIADAVEAGEITTPCHLYVGQEAVAVGICSALDVADTVWGGHRSHGHYLAKGGSLDAMIAEIFVKSEGCSQGRGGSMHLFAPEVGVLGTVPLVAATIPLAVGAALAAKLRGSGEVAVAFFGDGATEEGHFHESLNMAALYGLPVIFVCENNFYASHMALAERRKKDNIVAAADAHGLPGVAVDGNDVWAVREAALAATELARAGGGPTLIECRTYRWRGHVGPSFDMDVGVKRSDELSEWLPRDPVKRLYEWLVEQGFESQAQQAQVDVASEMKVAFERARAGTSPRVEELYQHVFSEAGRDS